MKTLYKTIFTLTLTLVSAATGLGCARASNDTSGFAIQDNVTVNAPFDATWQAMKGVLREQGYDLYTRDKRGIFVAYSPTDRSLLRIVPNRIKYTIEMAPVSSDETKVYIETIKQVYGTTLMTYPDWHDRKAEDNTAALEILNGLQAKLGGTEILPAPTSDSTPAEESDESTESGQSEVKVEDATEATPAAI